MVTPPFTVETFEALPSTQDAVRERLAAGQDVHGLVVRALEQSAGRGQRARDWSSGRGGSYQTVALRDSDPPVLRRPYAAVAVTLGLARALERVGVRARVKWPNDLQLDGQKLGGVLCEYTRGHLLVGIGLNVENASPPGAARLAGFTVEQANELAMEGVRLAVALLARGSGLAEEFAHFDALAGHEIEVATGNGPVRGTASGIDDDGCLRVETERGPRRVCGHQPGRGPIRRLS